MRRLPGGCRRIATIGCGGLVVLFLVGVVALFLVDRKLNPPVDAPDLVARRLPEGPPLPPGTILYDSDETGTFEVWALDAEGRRRALTDDASYDSWWARPAPDGRTVLFYRTPAGTHDRDFTATSLWAVSSDGGDPVELLPVGAHGWNLQGHAEWSPDGDQLVMFGGKRTNPRIFVTDHLGREPREVAGHAGTNVDPSWSPDGTTIVYAGCPSRICLPSDQEIYTVPSAGGERRRLTDDGVRDHDPYFSPDGTTIAFLSQTAQPDDDRPLGTWDIRLVDQERGSARRLIDDGNVNSMPQWLDGGREIVFHRFEYGRSVGYDLAVVDVVSGEVRDLLVSDDVEEYPTPAR